MTDAIEKLRQWIARQPMTEATGGGNHTGLDLLMRAIWDVQGLHDEQLADERERRLAAESNAAHWKAQVESLTAARDAETDRAESAEAERGCVLALPELEWAQASAAIAQGLALHAREDQPAAKHMLGVLDRAKTYVARLQDRVARAERGRDEWSRKCEQAESDMLRLQVERDEARERAKVEITKALAADDRAGRAEADNAALLAMLRRAAKTWSKVTTARMGIAEAREAIDPITRVRNVDHPGAALLEVANLVRQYQRKGEATLAETFQRLMKERKRDEHSQQPD